MPSEVSPTAGPVQYDRVGPGAVLLIVVLCVIWGVQQVAIKVSIHGGIPPLLQAGVRSAGSAVLVLLWALFRRGHGWRLFARDRTLWPGLAIALIFAGEFAFLYPGLARTSASRGVLFLYTAPFFVALGAHLFIPAERLMARQAMGLVCAFAGIGVAVLGGIESHGHAGTLLGDGLVLVGAALWGASTVLIKANPALLRGGVEKLLLYQLAGSAPLLILLSFVAGETLHPAAVTQMAVVCLLYQIVVVSFASYLAWFWLIVHYPASRISAFSFLTPIFGAAAGALLLGEHISLALVAALVLVIAGLRLVNPAARRRAVAAKQV